jgi:aquaporin rerated protein, invertebrate
MILYLKVSPLAGALIEGIATLLCRLASKTLSEKSPKHATILDSFIGTSLVVAGN